LHNEIGESGTMKKLLLRLVLAAVLIGPAVTFVWTVASTRVTVKYEPGVSEEEFKAYKTRSVSELDAFLKSRQVKFSRSQWLRESMGFGLR